MTTTNPVTNMVNINSATTSEMTDTQFFRMMVDFEKWANQSDMDTKNTAEATSEPTDSQCLQAVVDIEQRMGQVNCTGNEVTDSQCMVAAGAVELQDEAETFMDANTLIPTDLMEELTYQPSNPSVIPYYTLPDDMRDWASWRFMFEDNQPSMGEVLAMQQQASMPNSTFDQTTPTSSPSKSPPQAPNAPKRVRRKHSNKDLIKWSMDELREEYERRFQPGTQWHLQASKGELIAAIRMNMFDSIQKTIDEYIGGESNIQESSI